METHLFSECTRISPELRAQAQQAVYSSGTVQQATGVIGGDGTSGSAGVSINTSHRSGRKVVRMGPPPSQSTLQQHFGNMPRSWQADADVKQGRWWVHSGLAFKAADSPFFLDFVDSISKYKDYVPAGL